MISLSGLAATYPGYAAQEDQTAKTAKTLADTQANQTKQRDAAIKLLGANVAGAALAAGNGPQAPPPGQASLPSPSMVRAPPPPQGAPPPAPPMANPPQGAPPVPQGSMPPPAPQPAPAISAPQAAGAPSKMGLQEAVQRILRTTPGVANHPEVLLSALTHFNDLGMLDPEAEAKVGEAGKLHSTARVAAAKGHLKAVQDGAPMDDNTPAGAAPAPGPTATDPKTGAKVQWDGKAWQPLTN